ncbi:hypothetical protein [Bacillus cereus]|nr:hypothetical protein [Bacillus cereus]
MGNFRSIAEELQNWTVTKRVSFQMVKLEGSGNCYTLTSTVFTG